MHLMQHAAPYCVSLDVCENHDTNIGAQTQTHTRRSADKHSLAGRHFKCYMLYTCELFKCCAAACRRPANNNNNDNTNKEQSKNLLTLLSSAIAGLGATNCELYANTRSSTYKNE